MSRLETEADRQRRALLARERLAQRQLVTIYGQVFQRIRREITVLQRLVADAQRAGRGPAEIRHLLDREQRLQRFAAEASEQLARFVLHAEPVLTDLQRDHAQQAVGDTYALADLALGDRPAGLGWEFRPPSPSLVHRLIGNAGDGTPLGGVLREVAGAQVKQARDELLIGVARGHNPRVIGRAMAKAIGTTATRSIVIARQESLRAYREVTSATFQANANVINGWVWSSAGDTRTCGVCWAMTGTTHSADESLVSHISCRCSMVPQTRSWSDLGFTGVPDTRPTITPGVERFDRLASHEQRAILGPGKYREYAAGRLALPDLVGRTHSDRWGPGLRERPLREVAHA